MGFHYRLHEGDQVLEDSYAENQPVLYMQGRNGILDALEAELEGKQRGDKIDVTLPPEKAYGIRKPDAVERIPVKYLIGNKKPRKGQIVQVNTQHGPREVVVLKVGRFNVDVDTNHPMSGKTLRFDIEITEVREPTEEEISHGHAHGAGGHQH
ncbi:MAG: peptidylprolyl isomerase [Acidiferrobacterales bacterium]|nr:peptidylprolyl isomerase [Acidiferrobacterales bacterium]